MRLSEIFMPATIAEFKKHFGHGGAIDDFLDQESCPKLDRYWSVLTKAAVKKMLPAQASSDKLTVLDVGAGINFFLMYLTLCELFPTTTIEYVCADPATEGSALLQQLQYRGTQIRYLTVSATDITQLHAHGVTHNSIDLVVATYPVLLPPCNTLRMSERGHASLLQQSTDFHLFYKRVLPMLLKSTGCLLALTYDTEELSVLRQIISCWLEEGRALMASRQHILTSGQRMQEAMLAPLFQAKTAADTSQEELAEVCEAAVQLDKPQRDGEPSRQQGISSKNCM